jgi:hypothetical protein
VQNKTDELRPNWISYLGGITDGSTRRFYSVNQRDTKTEEDLGRDGMSMRSRNRLVAYRMKGRR